MITTPIIATKTNSPAIAGTKYVSAIEAGAGVGAVVAAGACNTLNAVVEDDGQYPLVPWNVAITLNVPGMSGCHTRAYAPV